jgi:transposase
MKTAPIQDFSGENIYVGFDVHKKSWKVTILTDYVYHKSYSQEPSVEKLINYLRTNFAGGTYHSAYEAGFCGFGIHRELSKLGVNSIVVNPADIPTTQKEHVQKEDKRDSNKIAKCLRSGDLKGIYVPSVSTVEDRGLIRMRHALVKDASRSKNRLKSFLYFHNVPTPSSFDNNQSHWSRRFMEWLKTIEMNTLSGKQSIDLLIKQVELLRVQILDATRQIRALSRSDRYAKNMDLITTIPGIGLITGMSLLTELDDIRRFESTDKLCSFIGLVPTMKSSGENESHGRITYRSNQLLRKMLIESSWIAVRHDPALMRSYHEYCKHMEANKAIIRIARKLLTRIQAVLRDQVAYKTLTY